jgi:hypothetical protein
MCDKSFTNLLTNSALLFKANSTSTTSATEFNGNLVFKLLVINEVDELQTVSSFTVVSLLLRL